MDAGRWLVARRGHILAFVFAFVLAFFLAWLVFRPAAPEAGGAKAELVLPGERVRDFLSAVELGDFAAMRSLGEALFRPGAALGGAEAALIEYETNGLPPLRVFLFHSGSGDGSVRRVLLTLDASNRVSSFLAEETRIVD